MEADISSVAEETAETLVEASAEDPATLSATRDVWFDIVTRDSALASSSVDAEAEAQIQRALAELLEGRTCLVVAHRLSTILEADEILVMHHGEIRERGDHRALLAAGGLYERLYRLQMAVGVGAQVDR